MSVCVEWRSVVFRSEWHSVITSNAIVWRSVIYGHISLHNLGRNMADPLQLLTF